jgi:hypothetical protein
MGKRKGEDRLLELVVETVKKVVRENPANARAGRHQSRLRNTTKVASSARSSCLQHLLS